MTTYLTTPEIEVEIRDGNSTLQIQVTEDYDGEQLFTAFSSRRQTHIPVSGRLLTYLQSHWQFKRDLEHHTRLELHRLREDEEDRNGDYQRMRQVEELLYS